MSCYCRSKQCPLTKMKTLAIITAFACLIYRVTAQSPAWGQCGGIGWSGSTTCVAGSTCTQLNTWAAPPAPTKSPTVTVPTPPPSTNAPTSTASGPAPTGSQIRADQDPVFHLYLQNQGGKPMLGPQSSSGYFTISGTISLNNPDGTKQFLNVQEIATTASYKPLMLNTTAITTDWGLEGDTIITTAPRQLNFLACSSTPSGFWDLFLQEGNDMPAGRSCSLISLHLPCLC